jgi:hypothetical protein
MGASRPAFSETAEGLFIPHPGVAGGRWGCVVLIAAAGLVSGIGCMFTGSIVPGIGLAAGGLCLALLVGAAPTPAGLAVTADAVRLERRSAFRADHVGVPRRLWKELWMEEGGEDKSLLYLLTSSPDGRETTYAVPLYSGAPEEARTVAGRVGDLLRLPWRSVVFPPLTLPGAGSLVDSVAGGVATYRKAREQVRQAVAAAGADSDSRTPESRGVMRQMARAAVTLARFGSVESPEAWFIDPEQATLTHLAADGTRTPHAFAEVADVEVEAELVGEERGSDSDTAYVYRYAVYLVLNPGRPFLIRRCASSEDRKTDQSAARRDSRWTARYLRETFGLPVRD